MGRRPGPKKGSKSNNPTGRGGFKSHPELINKRGPMAKSFADLRNMIQKIAKEDAIETDSQTGEQFPVIHPITQEPMSNLEVLVRGWMSEKKSELFVQYGFGRVPNPVELSGPEGKPIELHDDSRTKLARLISGYTNGEPEI